MIEASFGGEGSRRAPILGAYQYDTGQRLRMHGLPPPQVLSAADDFLCGDLAAVEVHYSHAGDSQSEMRLAVWDVERGVWTAAVPDKYLMYSEEVFVHVYVYHGEDGETVRAQTMYEGVFTPVARPAPFGVTTPEQEAAWQQKKTEIDIALSAADKAAQGALAVVQETHAAAGEARGPAQQAYDAAVRAQAERALLVDEDRRWARAVLSVTSLAPGAKAQIALTRTEDAVRMELGIPRGADGAKGGPGEKGPADVSFYADGDRLVIVTQQA